MPRTGLPLLCLLATLAGGGAAQAAHLGTASEPPWRTDALIVTANELSDGPPQTQLKQAPIGDVLAARIGLTNGSAELFRYRVENAPSDRAVLGGVVDGGGLKLMLTW